MSEGSGSVLVVGVGGEPSVEVPDLDDFAVAVADSVGGALDRVGSGGVDCVLVDAGADPESTLELVESVRERSSGTRVVVATASDDVATRALAAGAAEVLRDGLAEVPVAVVENRIRSVLPSPQSAQRCTDPIRDRGRILGEAVDVLDDVVYVVDEDDALVAWNRTLPERLGYSDEEMAGTTGAEVYPDEQWDEAIDSGTRERVHEGMIVVMDLVAKDGERIPHEFRSEWYDDPVTGQRLRVGIGREVSERRRVERALRNQNERIVELTESLVEELRSCLEVAYAATAKARESPDVGIDDVECALERIERVVENARDLSRAGRGVVDPSSVPLCSAAEAAWDEVPTAGSTLDVEGCGRRARGDPARLRRLFVEVFENAVEHGNRGAGSPVTVRVGTLADGFYVEDDGFGIPSAERDLVFEPGYSVVAGGHGFGLAIVDEIATAHGWRVDLCRSDEGGARLEFRDVDFVEE